ncbi:MAG: ATP phosphoribosyltransferase [Anaerolineae bacterium]|nr:ATP phosphoribosyltransferase [Anaerolineae bacterium]
MRERMIRLGLPTKGRMEEETLTFLERCGLRVVKPNPRQYVASIPAIPELEVWLQRSVDIVRKVYYGDVDLGITGYDSVAEHGGNGRDILILHDQLGFGTCRLVLAVPDEWDEINSVEDLAQLAHRRAEEGRPLRIGTKYERLVSAFLTQHAIVPYQLIWAEGALEAGPHMGYVDLIADLTASGVTLRENHLKEVQGGTLLHSQACLIGNRRALKQRPEVLAVAKQLLEFFEAHLRATGYHAIIANIKGESPEAVAQKVFSQPDLGGLKGPTIAPVYLRDVHDRSWYAISIIVRQERLVQAVQQLRAIGGSGVVVTPATYIFEDEPATYRRLVAALEEDPE